MNNYVTSTLRFEVVEDKGPGVFPCFTDIRIDGIPFSLVPDTIPDVSAELIQTYIAIPNLCFRCPRRSHYKAGGIRIRDDIAPNEKADDQY